MEYVPAEHTSGFKVLPPDVATETAALTSCDPSQQHNESEFENGESLVVAPPISRSPEADSGSEPATRACVSEPAPPTTTTGIAAVCNSISPNYCPVDYHTNNGYGGKLQDQAIEDATAAEGEVEDREEVVDPYRSNTNTDQDNHHNDNGLLALGGGVTSTRKSGVNHHQNIVLQGEEGELVSLEKRRCVRLREDTLPISDRDQHRTGAGSSTHQQQGVTEAESRVSYLDLRVIQHQGRYVSIETTSDSRLQNITDTALYDREGVKQAAGGGSRYHLEQLTAGSNNNDMPYSATTSPPNNLEDVCMRQQQQQLVENSSGEHGASGNVVLTAQPPHSFQLHGQGMRIRNDALPFGALFPHLTTNKILTEQHFSTAPQVLSFGIQDNHQNRENEDIIDKTRSHHQHHNQINGIEDVIHASLKPEEEVNSHNESRSERSHHHPPQQYLLSRAGSSPQHPDQEEYLQTHQESSSPETRRSGRSTSPADHHLQHHSNVILSRTQIHNSGGGGGGGGSGGRGRTPLLGNSNLSSGTGSAGNNSSSNTTSFTHLTTLQPSSSSTPSPLALGGNTTAEDGGGGNGSVLQQLSPAGDDETNEHRGMYATTPTSALEHHHHQHHHHLSGLHHSAGFHPHDAVAVSSGSALMHSPATNLTR